MRIIEVESERSYQVMIGSDWQSDLSNALNGRARVAIVMSKEFVPNLQFLENSGSELNIFLVPDGEAGKTIDSLAKIWDWFGSIGLTRSDLVVAIGGGSVTDLTGFAAASWLRGVDWIAVPTTLAGMVDAAIGGKTGINSTFGKNLIGAFHSPISVLVDSTWLNTLTDRDFSAGMAEVIKCGFVADAKILKLAKSNTVDSLRLDLDTLLELISRSIEVKAKVVTTDFKESFAREVLNYGHTLGHAIEVHAKYQLRHGEAVSIGLVFAAELAAGRGLLSADEVALHRIILSAYNLPTSYLPQAWQQLLPMLSLDKKSRGNIIRFVALAGIGSTLRLEDLTTGELNAAYERISS
jgi:3-dehydroquinate synthase